MLIEKFKELRKELDKYRADDSNLVLQKWELISICNHIDMVITKMKEMNLEYEMAEDELNDVKWVYNYLRVYS